VSGLDLDYWLIAGLSRKVEANRESTEGELDAVRDGIATQTAFLQQQIRALALSFNALVELLVEDGKLSIEDLCARVNAAVIAEQHEHRDRTDPAQDVWDSAKPK
jgi:hypothetical protein